MATRIEEISECRRGGDLLVRAELPFVHGPASVVAIRAEWSGPAEAPWLIAAGGISANAHVLARDEAPQPGWWQAQADSLSDYRILGIDWVGADGSQDRPIHPQDQARAMIAVLDELGIDRVAGLVGASYGAMVGMHLAAMAPERLGALLSISAPAASHPFTSANRAIQRQAIELGERSGNPGDGVALARKLAMLGYRTEAEFAERFADAPTVHDNRVHVAAEPYLDAQGERHRARMEAVTYRRLSESIDLHRIDPTTISVATTYVAIDSDRIVPIGDIRDLAARTPDARLHEIHSLYGHDAFLKEQAAIGRIISQFLDELDADQ